MVAEAAMPDAGPEATPTARVALLPAIQGGDQLAGRLRAAMPRSFHLEVVHYPPGVHTYEDLLPFVTEQLASREPQLLLAESFSGPLAIHYASENSARVRGIVLSASFILAPKPRWLSAMPLRTIFALARPRAAIRLVLTNGFPDETLVEEIYDVGQELAPELMAARVRMMLAADATRTLTRYGGPLLYLRARRDRLVGPRSLREIARIRPDIVVTEIDAPHLILQTRPVEAWRAISSFLRLQV